ncbi:hypothetical protein C8A05DRAFT_16503 [Staphylotrichum tortipilum]|uniref:Rhodopsin domain-containing protein n=1 Tax=Staphylotrichum tortipilum TaxID=2831512 RepID=A0AAN6RS12_9PEZI|nr:hypothetical protein C8A05DRAFT_16503 [Staphylotrichum longicolle]
MRSAPPEVVATWPKPNYVNPEYRGPDLIIAGLVTLVFAIISLVLRMYVRFRIMRKTDWDDWFMVVATVFSLAATISIVLGFGVYGWKYHVWDLTLEKLIQGRKASMSTQAFFIPATMFTKVSILLSYLRLAPLNSWFRRLSLGAPWVIGSATIAFWVVLFTECKPVSSYWNLRRTAQDCLDETPILFSYAISTVIFDFFVWALPLPTIYRANLPLHQRLALIALFSVGLFVVVAAGIRIYYLDIVLRKTYDVTWEGSHLWSWVAVEANLGIICGCVPWLKSLLKKWRGKKNGTGSGGSGASGSGRNRQEGGVQTIGSGGPVFRMDGLKKGSVSAGGREKGKYIDLESCYDPSDPDTRPASEPGERPG